MADISYSNSNRTIDTVATHTCQENYIAVGDHLRNCTPAESGTAEWDLPEDICQRMLAIHFNIAYKYSTS